MRAPAPLPESLTGRPFLVAEAREAGVHAERMRRSDLTAPFRGVRTARVDGLRDLAAAYATRMPAHHAFGGVTAARQWGLPLPTEWSRDEPLVVARPTGTTRGRARGTVHIAVDPAFARVTTHRGLRLLAPVATALTLARDLPHERLVHVVDALLTPSQRYPDLDLPRRPHTTAAELLDFLARCGRLRGARALRAAAADARSGVDSRFETITRRTIVLAGLPEPVVHPLVVVDGIELHPDLGYPELKVAVEYEGEVHLDPKRWADDILRYEMLEAAGWIVVRITKGDLARDGERCVRRVRAALARRG
ncbi:MAG: endonuclease domain-containing protein [Actinomycetota bacterium]